MVIPFLRAVPGGTEIAVHVQPGAARAELVGLHGDALKVRIPARAVEGAANAALVNFIAHALGVPNREVKILRGDKSRRKVLEIPLPVEDVALMLTERV
jgi:hypothetical protein